MSTIHRAVSTTSGNGVAVFACAGVPMQTLPNAVWTKLGMIQTIDNGGGAMDASGLFTCQVAGVYDMSAGLIFAGDPAPPAGGYINVEIRTPIYSLKVAETTLGASGPTSTLGAGPLRLRVGDTVELWAYTSPGLTVYGNSFFSVLRVSE